MFVCFVSHEQPSFNQDRDFSVDQEKPDHPQIEEHKEQCSSELELKQKHEDLKLHSADGENNSSGDRVVDWPSEESSGDCGLPVIVPVLSEANVDVSCYPGDSPSLVQNNSQDGNTNSTGQKSEVPSTNCHNMSTEGNISVTQPTFQKNPDFHIEKYLCNTCELKFSSSGAFLQHMQKHSVDKPFVCPICSRGFGWKCNLRAHEKTHTCEKPYVCQKCDRAFVGYKMLKNHMGWHNSEKLYMCQTCGKGYTIKSEFLKHTSDHLEEKLHVCQKRDKCFVDVRRLQSHQKLHTGEKRFECQTCGKRFLHKSYLKKT